MIETSRGFSAIGWALLVIFVAGCDSSLPNTTETRLSVPADSEKFIEESFDTFDSWETIVGNWSVQASDARQVAKQSAIDQKYPVALLRQPTFADVDVTVAFRPLSGEKDASGGIVFRAQDGSNYYVVRANSLEDNYRLYATVAGTRHQIAHTRINAPAIDKWHTLRVVAVGEHIQAYLNGELLIDHYDDRFTTGRIGLWTKADAVTEFADFNARGT